MKPGTALVCCTVIISATALVLTGHEHVVGEAFGGILILLIFLALMGAL